MPKSVEKMTPDERAEAFLTEYKAISRKYGADITASLVYDRKGIRPKIEIVDQWGDAKSGGEIVDEKPRPQKAKGSKQ